MNFACEFCFYLTEPTCLVSRNRYHEDRETQEGIPLKYIFLSDLLVAHLLKVRKVTGIVQVVA